MLVSGGESKISSGGGIELEWLCTGNGRRPSTPLARLVEVLVRVPQGGIGPEGRWSIQATFADPTRVRVDPFAAVELELDLLWADVR